VRRDRLGADPVDHDELGAAPGARHEADVPARDVELARDQPQERLVRGSLDRRGRDPRLQDPVDDAIDRVGPAPRCQQDGEADVGRVQGTRRRVRDPAPATVCTNRPMGRV